MLRTATIDPSLEVVLISDMHIGDGSKLEPFVRADDALRRFFDRVVARADALVIVGDGFDLAQAWSVERIYAGHRALVDDLVSLAASLPVYYLQGNHDGSAEILRRLLPLRYADRLTIGPTVAVEHGNRFDPRNLPGDERALRGARVHSLLERVIRSPVRIPMRKHYHWSTRLGHWLFFRYGHYRHAKARLWDALGEPERAAHERSFLDYWGRGEWGDIHGMLPQARAMLAGVGGGTLVLGHSHTPGRVEFAQGTYVNTGSWTYGEASYVRCSAGRCEVLAWPTGRTIGDEEYRGVLGPHHDKTFFDWWDAFYRGWFCYDVAAMDRAAAAADIVDKLAAALEALPEPTARP